MCKFFSFVTQPSKSKDFYYFDWKQRLEEKHNGTDSHSHICAHYFLNEDTCNKWEYNPFTDTLKLDMQNDEIDDSRRVRRWVSRLDFKTVVGPLIIKPIVNPFDLPKADKPTKEQIDWLESWASVWDSVWGSVREAVWGSVGEAVRGSVGEAVWGSVGEAVRGSVGEAVWGSVRASVWGSIYDAVGACSSYLLGMDPEYEYLAVAKLWEAGLVPSYDGTTWRLHSGTNAEIVYEWKPEGELK